MNNRNPHRSKRCQRNVGIGIIFGTSLLLVAAFIIFFLGVPTAVQNKIKLVTRLVNGSETWEKWTNVKVPIRMKFYFFNVTNPDAVSGGSKFILDEVGPYTFEQKRTKTILAIDEEEDTVTYRDVVFYKFRPDLSSGSYDDKVNIVNIPFISVANRLHQKLFSFMANSFLDVFVDDGESLVMRGVKIREVTFEGVPLNSMYGTLSDLAGVEPPPQFKGGTFGFFNGRNGSNSQPVMKAYRGVKSSKDFGKVVSFNNLTELPYWKDPELPPDSEQYCNMINGSDGSTFSPFLTKSSIIPVFAHDVCRSMYAVFIEEVDYKGIPAYKFRIPRELMESKYTNPENRCYCKEADNDALNPLKCLAGIMALSVCKNGAPIALSKPHMLHGDPKVLGSVEGLQPNETGHETELIIEPLSGAALSVVKRIQINAELLPLPDITAFEHVHPAYVPALWIEERADVSDEGAAEIRSRLVTPLKVVGIVQWVTIGTLFVLLLVAINLTVALSKENNCGSEESQPSNPRNNSS